jgi:hypothetical protein
MRLKQFFSTFGRSIPPAPPPSNNWTPPNPAERKSDSALKSLTAGRAFFELKVDPMRREVEFLDRF